MKKRQYCRWCGCWIGDARVNGSVMCVTCDREYAKKKQKEHRRRNGINSIVKKTNCSICGVWIGNERIGNHAMCKTCYNKDAREYHYQNGTIPARENPDCSVYLGDIGEELVCAVFEGAERMPYGFSGYDFICAGGWGVDVKTSSWRKDGGWSFDINKNTIADYFACVAFDNRQDINVLHFWVIPGHEINHLKTFSMSISRIPKFAQYEQDLDEILTCCSTMKNSTQPHTIGEIL